MVLRGGGGLDVGSGKLRDPSYKLLTDLLQVANCMQA